MAFTCVHNRCFLPFKTVKVWNRSKLVFKLLFVRQDQLSLNQKVQVLAIFLGRMAYSEKCFDQSWCNGQRGWRTTILHPWPICWPICCQRSRILAWHRLVNGIWKVTSRWWSRTAPCCYGPILAMLVTLDIPVPFVVLRKLHGMTTLMSECGLVIGTGFAGGPRHQDYWSWHRWYQAAFSSKRGELRTWYACVYYLNIFMDVELA